MLQHLIIYSQSRKGQMDQINDVSAMAALARVDTHRVRKKMREDFLKYHLMITGIACHTLICAVQQLWSIGLHDRNSFF